MAPGPVSGRVTIPGSKSATARAYVLAALADRPSVLDGVLDARDTRLMRAALTQLGVAFTDLGPDRCRVTPPPRFTPGGDINCGLAGTVMRFVPPLAATAAGTTSFHGDPEASARPVAPLLSALADLGAVVSTPYSLPFTVTGGPAVTGGDVTLDSSASSQFLSALLLVGARLPKGLVIRHVGPNIPSRPHIDMTVAMLRERGVTVSEEEPATWRVRSGRIAARDETIEPDLTNAATFLAAALATGGTLGIAWPQHSIQPQTAVLEVLATFGATITVTGGLATVTGPDVLPGVDLDLHEVSELTCAVAALAALASGPSRIRGVAHIRGHETDRLAALERELRALGADVIQTDDGLIIIPRPLHGGLFGTYADQRMAHAAAIVGLRVPGVQVDDIECTTKTMPDFPGLWTRMVIGR